MDDDGMNKICNWFPEWHPPDSANGENASFPAFGGATAGLNGAIEMSARPMLVVISNPDIDACRWPAKIEVILSSPNPAVPAIRPQYVLMNDKAGQR